MVSGGARVAARLGRTGGDAVAATEEGRPGEVEAMDDTEEMEFGGGVESPPSRKSTLIG